MTFFVRCFRIYDDDGNKKLDYREFVNGLNDYGIMIPKEEMQQVFSRFDLDKSGTIDFDEFLENLRVSSMNINVLKPLYKRVVVRHNLKNGFTKEYNPPRFYLVATCIHYFGSN